MHDEQEAQAPGLSPPEVGEACERADHRFGGPWTEIKLDAVMYFIGCYTKALTPVGFDLWYVDAFAGSGDRRVVRECGGIFSGEPLHTVTETLSGSARRALTIEPSFNHFVFNEPDPERNRALQCLRREHSLRDIRVFDGDANAVLRDVFGAPRWRIRAHQKARAVVFLDPYALQVDWATLEMLAKTKAVDVWYLFPLRDVTRQLARTPFWYRAEGAYARPGTKHPLARPLFPAPDRELAPSEFLVRASERRR